MRPDRRSNLLLPFVSLPVTRAARAELPLPESTRDIILGVRAGRAQSLLIPAHLISQHGPLEVFTNESGLRGKWINKIEGNYVLADTYTI